MACAALAVLAPSAARANKTQSMTFEATGDLRDPATRAQAFDDIAALGVHSMRVVLYWHDVAPEPDSRVKPKFDETAPSSYDWGTYDAVVDGIKARGWSLLLTVSGPVPRWATNGARDTLTRPSPNEFRKFVQAVAAHYGSKADTWSIWNEPNQPQFLKPQYSAAKTPLSPRIYRNLYFAAQRGLRNAGLGNARVLLGETSPRGTGNVVAPLTFLRGVLCLDDRYRKASKRCAKVQASGYAHHAYTTGQGPSFKPEQPNDVTIGVLSRLTTALDRAAKAGAITSKLPLYLTEFGIESKPDPVRGVSLQRQSEYRAISERIAYENPRVVAFSQYLLRDDKAVAGAPIIERYPGFQTGLFTAGGTHKPSYDGFRLPLVARRGPSKVSLWGLVRPAGAPTTAMIEAHKKGAPFRPLTTVRTDARGYFATTVAAVGGREWRLVWTAPDGTVFRGTPTRAYAR
ncbi:MAG TPA: cellulase family glycosylhydrolase [Solirubrobacteraceae bacterium]